MAFTQANLEMMRGIGGLKQSRRAQDAQNWRDISDTIFRVSDQLRQADQFGKSDQLQRDLAQKGQEGREELLRMEQDFWKKYKLPLERERVRAGEKGKGPIPGDYYYNAIIESTNIPGMPEQMFDGNVVNFSLLTDPEAQQKFVEAWRDSYRRQLELYGVSGEELNRLMESGERSLMHNIASGAIVDANDLEQAGGKTSYGSGIHSMATPGSATSFFATLPAIFGGITAPKGKEQESKTIPQNMPYGITQDEERTYQVAKDLLQNKPIKESEEILSLMERLGETGTNSETLKELQDILNKYTALINEMYSPKNFYE